MPEVKLVMPMKRRPGMTIEAFRNYYETHHRLLGEKYLAGYVTRYFRRYLKPLRARDGTLTDPEYDVILEIWYPDMESFEACGKHLGRPEIAREIREDEEKIFNMDSMLSYLVEEYESEMPPLAGEV